MKQGELLCGVLDKAQFGPSQFGLVHSCCEVSITVYVPQVFMSVTVCQLHICMYAEHTHALMCKLMIQLLMYLAISYMVELLLTSY